MRAGLPSAALALFAACAASLPQSANAQGRCAATVVSVQNAGDISNPMQLVSGCPTSKLGHLPCRTAIPGVLLSACGLYPARLGKEAAHQTEFCWDSCRKTSHTMSDIRELRAHRLLLRALCSGPVRGWQRGAVRLRPA